MFSNSAVIVDPNRIRKSTTLDLGLEGSGGVKKYDVRKMDVGRSHQNIHFLAKHAKKDSMAIPYSGQA